MAGPNPDATWTELLLLTQSVVQNLDLAYGSVGTSLPPGQVYNWKIPTDGYRLNVVGTGTKIPFPNVQVCPGRLEDVANQVQDFQNTTIIYPVLVVIMYSDNKSLAINNDLLYWREEIYSAFVDFPDTLAAVVPSYVSSAEVWDCQITAQPVFDLAVWQQQNLDFSWLILNYKTTRSRGRTGEK